MVEIILDPSIRDWVVLPMVIIFGCSAMVRHYVTLLLKTDKLAAVDELRPMYVAITAASASAPSRALLAGRLPIAIEWDTESLVDWHGTAGTQSSALK